LLVDKLLYMMSYDQERLRDVMRRTSLLDHFLAASGPPLPVLLTALEKLRDLRTAAWRDDIPSRYADFDRLRDSLK